MNCEPDSMGTALLSYLRLQVAATIDYGEPLEDDVGFREDTRSNDRAHVQNRAVARAKSLVEAIRDTAVTFLGMVDIGNLHHQVRCLSQILAHAYRPSRMSISSYNSLPLGVSYDSLFKRLQHSISPWRSQS